MSTSARMLSLLSLLQTHRFWPGDELATRLEVSPRTLRRDIERLRDLGYAVDAARGVAGGYQLRAGGTLPPLVLEDDEAVAIAVGLRSAAADSDAVVRRVEPHRLVSLGRRWYLVGFDRDRDDWRSFRVDRMSEPASTGRRFLPRDLPATDALTFVQSGIRRMPQRYDVRVVVDAPVDDVRRAVGIWGEVEPLPDGAGCRLSMNVDDLRWPVMVLAQVEGAITVESPPELRDALRRTAQRFASAT
jgi:predicted DNA-binding transcriptional regulator YafY